MSASRRKHDPAFKGEGGTERVARGRDGGGTGGPFRDSSAPDLCLEEGADGGGAQGVAVHLGRSEEVSERKLAELYEQVGRLMVERDFLLRRSGL
jgi:hypothetical protein